MQDKKHYLYIVAIALVLVLTIYFVALSEMDTIIMFFKRGLGDDPNEDRGLFGDSTGAINTLFSSLAFAGVILTIYWQIQESSKNKEEDHRKQFEDVFFRMAGNFEQIIAGLRIEVQPSDTFDYSSLWDAGSNSPSWRVASVNDGPITTPSMTVKTAAAEIKMPEVDRKEGREVFQFLYEQRKKEGKSLVEHIGESGIEGYEGFMEGELDHYFRYFYRILRYIDDSKLIDDKQKYSYATILRAHLSIYELLLIHYNGLSEDGYERLKPLIEKYAMLDNIRETKLVNGLIERERDTYGKDDYYKDSAFGRIRQKGYGKIVKLRNKTIWSGLLMAAAMAFALPLWNKTVVNDILQKIPGDSFPLLFLILAISVLYIWIKWKEDALLVKEIHDLKNPTGERKEEIEKKIIDRCGVVPLIAMIIAAGIVAVIGSNYYVTGGLTFGYFYVACYPLLYQIMAVIIIRLEVQDAKLVRKVDLFEREEKHHE